jgi:hypothetical protein
VLNLVDPAEIAEAVSLFVSLGFGKGVLSRNAPDFIERDKEGLEGATADRPFAVPRRLRLQQADKLLGTPSEALSQHDTAYEVEEFQFSYEEALYLVDQISAVSVSVAIGEPGLNAEALQARMTTLHKEFEIRYFGMNITNITFMCS